MSLIKHSRYLTNPFIVVAGSVGIFLLCQLISTLLLQPILPRLSSDNYQLTVFIVVNTAILFLLLRSALQVTGAGWRAVGWVRPRPRQLLNVLPAFVVYFAVSASLVLLASRFLPGFDANQAQDVGFKNMMLSKELLAGFISLVILTPIFEETIFRGVLFKGLRRSLPFWVSAVLSSALFAVAHGQWNVALDTFALGMISSYILERSGTIATSITLHALKNGLAFCLLFLLG